MQEQNNKTPEMAQQTATPEAEKPQKSQIETLADMFRGEPAEEQDAGESPATGETAEKHQKVTPPKALKDLAEKLGIKPEDLYGIEVPYADGKTKTLGQLKDYASKEGDLSVRELAIEEHRTKQEAELLRARAELNELVSALRKDALKPEVLNAVRQKHEATIRRERGKTLELIPEWKDEAKRTEEIQGIVEHLKEYGFPANYLQTIYDARAIKYIRESYLREQRIRKALEKVQGAPPSATKKSKPTGMAPKKPNATSKKTFDSPQSRLLNIFE